MKELIKRLTSEFDDNEYAHAYMEDHLVTRLAAQIYALRKQRGWSQEDLAKKSGVAQERISKIEAADFSSLTMKTLNKFSRAFDVNLMIGFDSFSNGILDVVNLKPKALEISSRSEDLEKFKNTYYVANAKGDWVVVEKLGVPTRVVTIAPKTTTLNWGANDQWNQMIEVAA